MVRTFTCTGASQTGNLPAVCSMTEAMKRSKLPKNRPVDDDRRFSVLSAVDVLQVEALRRLKSSWIVAHWCSNSPKTFG